MSELQGNLPATFESTGQETFYDNEPQVGAQLYLESVLPTAYDPTLEAFDTRGIRPREYPGMTKEGFFPQPANPYQYTFNNSIKFFFPEHKEQVL